MAGLTDGIWVQILQMITMPDRWMYRTVCRKWSQLVPLTVSVLDLREKSDEPAKRGLRSICPKVGKLLKVLQFNSDFYLSSDVVDVLIQHCPNITQLVVGELELDQVWRFAALERLTVKSFFHIPQRELPEDMDDDNEDDDDAGGAAGEGENDVVDQSDEDIDADQDVESDGDEIDMDNDGDNGEDNNEDGDDNDDDADVGNVDGDESDQEDLPVDCRGLEFLKSLRYMAIVEEAPSANTPIFRRLQCHGLKIFHAEGKKMSNTDLEGLVSGCPNIEDFTIHEAPFTNVAALARLNCLKKLTLDGFDDMDGMSEVGRSNGATLAEFVVNQGGNQTFTNWDFLALLSGLERITLELCRAPTIAEFKKIPSTAPLRHVEILDVGLEDNDGFVDMLGSGRYPTLQELIIGEKWQDSYGPTVTVGTIEKLLRTVSSVRVCEFYGDTLADDLFGVVLKYGQNLNKLALGSDSITMKGVLEFLKNRKSLVQSGVPVSQLMLEVEDSISEELPKIPDVTSGTNVEIAMVY